MIDWHVMYLSSGIDCKWCKLAKELLDVYGIDYYIKDIHTNEVYKKEFIAAGHRTVPQIYLEGTLIGGYEKTKEYLRLRHSEAARDEILAERLTRI